MTAGRPIISTKSGIRILIDREDFECLSKFKWHLSGGYAQRTFNIGNYKVRSEKMHRLVLERSGVDIEGKIVDHKNFNKLDNRKFNLRLVSSSQNNAHKEKQRNNKSGFKGVSWDKQARKWKASISIDRKDLNLGRFLTAEEAALKYNEKATKLYGDYCYLNKI